MPYTLNPFTGKLDYFRSATSGTGLTIVSVNGTIDDSNLSFTATSTPTVLVINGGVYQPTGGSITWTGTTSITLSSPVGTRGNIFGLK